MLGNYFQEIIKTTVLSKLSNLSERSKCSKCQLKSVATESGIRAWWLSTATIL